jgi:hypothetical protein
MDPADAQEEVWCDERREEVSRYLKSQNLQHGAIGEVPAWFSAPYISVWAIESLKNPGWVGWWAISGDVPADYCAAENCRHPRLALKRIAESWNEDIAATRDGDATIGQSGLPSSLLPLLKARAQLLLEFSADDELWPE